MSPSSKSKSKDKRAGKDQKVSSKAPGTVNGTSGIPASAYNPVLGTFHTLETSPTSSLSSLQVNGRFHNIDETDDNSGTHGSGADYDSASNNDSRSVESEEHKDKALNVPVRQEVIPGADNDKREKVRQKNERKHQRQKEKRALELHERCSGYLMSRKLEALSQQLVGMGFPAERVTMALIFYEGRAEEAIAWLLEGGEEADKHKDQNLDTGGNLKIDISEELGQISEMEVRFKCGKPEVERAIVACEGDLEKAEETLRSQKQDPALSSKPEETSDPTSMSNGKISLASNQNSARLLQKPTSTIVIQLRKDDKELNYTKAAASVGPTPKILTKSVQPVTRVQSKLEWGQLQQMTLPTEKRWPAGGVSSSPSVSYSLVSPLQVPPPPTKTESRHVQVTAEHKNAHPRTTLREPVVMMQRPQSVNGKLMAPVNSRISSSQPGAAPSWYPTSSEMMKPNGLLPYIPTTRSVPNGLLPYIPTTRSVSPNDLTSNHQLYQQAHFHQQHQFVPGTSPVDRQAASRAQALWKRVGSSPTLPVASSLGLFSGLGSVCSSGSTSPVDWHTGGSMSSCDYNNIDWSLDRTFMPSIPKPTNGFWQGLGSSYHPKSSSLNIYESNPTAGGLKQATRPPSSNGRGVSVNGFQDNVGPVHADVPSAGSREWTSPFEGKDLFSLPRQFVSSPSL